MRNVSSNESQLRLTRAEQDDDQDSRSIKLRCVSRRSSRNIPMDAARDERTHARTHAATHRIASHRIEQANRSRLRNRSAKRTPASPLECISAGASMWFLPFPLPFASRPLPAASRPIPSLWPVFLAPMQPRRRREKRKMHSCGNASCHSRRLPRDNKLSGLCIGEKAKAAFHMQNTYAP